METPEEQIKRLEDALKTEKLKKSLTFITGAFVAIVLSITTFYLGIKWDELIRHNSGANLFNQLVIPLNDPPNGYGNRIESIDQIQSMNNGFSGYQNMLDGGKVIIPNNSTVPDTFNLKDVYPKFETISVEALAKMLQLGQKTDAATGAIIQPAYIRIQDSKLEPNGATPKVKKYLMMVDQNNSLIRDNSGKVIYYDELRRCPTHCNVTEE